MNYHILLYYLNIMYMCIFKAFQNIGNIDESRLEELKTRTRDSETIFNKTLLSNAVFKMKTALNNQRRAMDNIKAKNDQLKDTIRRFRDLKDGLRQSAGNQ